MAKRYILADIEAFDRADPLRERRELFALPEGLIYLDGNSLGALPRVVEARVADVVANQWGRDLITSWNVHDWIDLPVRVGNRIARLIGAPAGTVVATDSTSVNLYKVLAVALRKRRSRRVILTEAGNFPTDLYIAESLAHDLGFELRRVPAAELAAGLTPEVAVLLLTEVNYATGARHDITALTARAHEVGALAVWDLAHSAGAFPIGIAASGADFAVGCGYKYLNGGPGAPAFVYVSERHLFELRQPLSGWLGHEAPFAFAGEYCPAAGTDAMRVGTPPILSLAALDAALEVFDGVDLSVLKAKADRLTDIFISEVAALAPELDLLTPREPEERGSQLCFRFPEAYAAVQALIARGIIGDFREPDVMRFGFAPLYLRHIDAWKAATQLGRVIEARAWDRPQFRQRAKVV